MIPTILIITIISFAVTMLTKITSNTTITIIMLPILTAAAVAAHIHPFLLMIPATIGASYAFILPVATPPNTIVFTTSQLTIPLMARKDFILNLIGVITITLLTFTLVMPIFGFSASSFPSWTAAIAR